MSSSDSDLNARWFKAMQELTVSPTSLVKCPKCEECELDVSDVTFGDQCQHLERHLSCPRCGAYNAILLRNYGSGDRETAE